MALEYAREMKGSEDEQFQDSFGKFIRSIDEYMNTDSIGEQFGGADVYDNATLNWTNSSRAPGSRSIGKCNAREERGKGGKGNRRDANLTNWGDRDWDTDSHQIQEGVRRKWRESWNL